MYIAAFLALGLASWAVGLEVFDAVLRVAFDKGVMAGDSRALKIWSALAYFPCPFVVYLPAFVRLDDRVSEGRRLVLFGMVGALLGLIPLLVLGGIFGGREADLFSARVAGFAGLFVIPGAFAISYALVMPRVAAALR